MMLHHFEPSIDLNFWKSMSFPDIYELKIKPGGQAIILRMWGVD
jgi:hypothetical protein